MNMETAPIRRDEDGRIRHIDVSALMRTPDGFARLRAALDEIDETLPEDYDIEQPPWLICPATQRDSVTWKVRRGARVVETFAQWYRTQAPDLRRRIQARYPEPRGWQGFYASLA